MNTSHQQHDALNADELHSACYIDENGNEIRITRDMIEKSCRILVRDQEQKKQPARFS